MTKSCKTYLLPEQHCSSRNLTFPVPRPLYTVTFPLLGLALTSRLHSGTWCSTCYMDLATPVPEQVTAVTRCYVWPGIRQDCRE
jgi:hypothetical protein